MPAPTPEALQKKVDSFKKSLEEKGEGMEPLERRRAQKQLRRAQRKHRRLVTAASRQTGKAAEKKAEEPKAEAPKAEEPKAEEKQEAPAEQAES